VLTLMVVALISPFGWLMVDPQREAP